jgi:hypothetical protein
VSDFNQITYKLLLCNNLFYIRIEDAKIIHPIESQRELCN